MSNQNNCIKNYEVQVEVVKEKSSTYTKDFYQQNIINFLLRIGSSYVPVTYKKCDFGEDHFLNNNVVSIQVIYCDDGIESGHINFNEVTLKIHLYQLNEREDYYEEEIEHDNENVVAAENWVLPMHDFDGLWESLVFENEIKSELLRYAYTALLFSDNKVSPSIVSWNKIILLHGPPGTGKTTLCRALAQKLAIRLSHRFNQSHLIEINSHSLFSKWFSESGKLVAKMMRKILDYVENKAAMLFVLIDEIESLTAMRQAALSGNEPSDSIRVVNSLLTQLDKIKHHSNVFIFTTSNITEAIDTAFLDRVDLKVYVGLPGPEQAYNMLRSSLHELMYRRILHQGEQFISHRALKCMQFTNNKVSKSSLILWILAEKCTQAKMSGRTLRKLTFLAYARNVRYMLCGHGNNNNSGKINSSPNSVCETGPSGEGDVYELPEEATVTAAVGLEEFLEALSKQVDDMLAASNNDISCSNKLTECSEDVNMNP